MECQAEIFKRKVIQLAFEMGAQTLGYMLQRFGKLVFPDGSTLSYIDFRELDTRPSDAEIHPPYCIEYQEATVREYVTE